MRAIFSKILNVASIISMCSCSPGRISNARNYEANKRTVTFNTHNASQLNGIEQAVATTFLFNEKQYFAKYIEVNYDSINNIFNSSYSNLNYWNKTKFDLSHKRRYRLYAVATGTDHLLDLNESIKYDTVRTAEESNRIWDHLWENNNTLTKDLVGAKEAHYFKETYHIKRIKYKLRYIDGHTGKTLWSMKSRWPAGVFGTNKQNPILLLKKKFEDKFPYKLTDS